MKLTLAKAKVRKINVCGKVVCIWNDDVYFIRISYFLIFIELQKKGHKS